MRLMRRTTLGAALGAAVLFAKFLPAQEPTPPPAPAPTPTPAAVAAEPSPLEALREPVAFRPIESNVIINLPSVEVPTAKTLTFIITHRFVQRIQEGNINNFFTLDSGNTWGFGLWYAPVKNLNVGLYRTSDLNTYEGSAQYQLPSLGGFGSSLRVGEDWRTEPGVASPKSSFFAQAVLAYSFGQYVRLTAVPTYLQDTNGFPIFVQEPIPGDQSCVFVPDQFNPYRCSGYYKNVFNVPIAASIAITHSITVHGEVIPRLSKVNSNGVGWSVTVEKSLLRHRFAFFAGNQRQTTVDEYMQAVPLGRSASNIYLGFNLFRAWNFK
ncbi:MAG TPA: DUF5777 family beta-barrel protein [Thermoanaerobaculia bacterium]|nr:DUF5777 family beta-barrel protein [Thermoanaerobaculia bacterium]